ncbi:MAG: hypothetical protein M5U33_06430 [Pseudorhodoplanes sp.]|nr:hypothetical protein [Pseudorhodoplanes sp.]
MALSGQVPSPARAARAHERRQCDRGIDGRIEKGVEMVVGESLATPGMDLALTSVIATEDEKSRRLR